MKHVVSAERLSLCLSVLQPLFYMNMHTMCL